MRLKKPTKDKWRSFQDFNDDVITITKLEDSLLHIRAWKKAGQNFVPALETVFTISPEASPAKLGAFIQGILNAAIEKDKWRKN